MFVQESMHPAISHALRYLILTVGAVLIMLVYVLPSTPKTIVGWAWLFVLSLPYSFAVGIAGHLILRYRSSNKILQFSAVALACVAIVLLTAGLLYLVGLSS
jgi:hypothetical protein